MSIEQAKAGKPLLGICLGMQLLFDRSFEYGEHEGLGLLKGDVVDMRPRIPADLKVPQIGWNALIFKQPDASAVSLYSREGDCVYFVHSLLRLELRGERRSPPRSTARS